MKYTKPEVTVVSQAVTAIQATDPKAGVTSDNEGGHLTGSAYEADE
jgi:hypothetical protein